MIGATAAGAKRITLRGSFPEKVRPRETDDPGGFDDLCAFSGGFYASERVHENAAEMSVAPLYVILEDPLS